MGKTALKIRSVGRSVVEIKFFLFNSFFLFLFKARHFEMKKYFHSKQRRKTSNFFSTVYLFPLSMVHHLLPPTKFYDGLSVCHTISFYHIRKIPYYIRVCYEMQNYVKNIRQNVAMSKGHK